MLNVKRIINLVVRTSQTISDLQNQFPPIMPSIFPKLGDRMCCVRLRGGSAGHKVGQLNVEASS